MKIYLFLRIRFSWHLRPRFQLKFICFTLSLLFYEPERFSIKHETQDRELSQKKRKKKKEAQTGFLTVCKTAYWT